MASFIQSQGFHGNNNNNSSCLSAFRSGSSINYDQQTSIMSVDEEPSHKNFGGGMRNSSNESEEMKETEDYLSSELSKLTTEERAKALDDLHCVGEDLQEFPELMQESLLKFDAMVNKQQNEVYKRAVRQNRAYVEDPCFRLRFLRFNFYDIHRSVNQMMNFLKHKEIYFGTDKLARNIKLEDLNEDDVTLMLAGLYHIHDGKDRTGRVIFSVMTEMLGKCKIENLIHVYYYMVNEILLPMPEVQTKGVVGIYYDVTQEGEKLILPGFGFMMTLFNVCMSIPMRYSGLHLCPRSGQGNLALNSLFCRYCMNLFPVHARVRSRLHYGTHMEVQYSLIGGHGLPRDTFPVDMNGKIRWDILNAWFYNHKARVRAAAIPQQTFSMQAGNAKVLDGNLDDVELMNEDLNQEFEADFPMMNANARNPQQIQAVDLVVASSSNSNAGLSTSIVPRPNDVLLGRGRGVQHHNGNIRFRNMLEPYRENYDRTPRKSRRQYSAAVTNYLIGSGIRFLQKAPNGDWIESSFEEADRKVGQLFRTLRKKG